MVLTIKLLYISDHRFIKKKTGEVFTTGQMSENYFNRFKDSVEYITVIGFCEDANNNNIRKIIQSVNINSDFVKYIFIQTSGTILGKLYALRNIKREYIKQLKLHEKVMTKGPSLILGLAERFAKKYNVPLLVEMVGCPFDSLWNHSIKGKLLAPFMWKQTRKFIKRAPYVLYVTDEFLQRRYPTRGQSIGCSDVELPLISKDFFKKRINKIEQIDKGRPIIIGTIGSISVKYKGQQFVIEAISHLNKSGFDFEYYLLGGGDDSHLKVVAKKYGVLDKVKFLGTLPHDKVFEFLDNIDIYIQPSKTEGLPRSLVEAMSRGCPALGSKTGGIPELLNKESIFHSGSVSEISTVIKKMNQDTMLKEAKRNFEKAKEYEKELLHEKRTAFYLSFLNEYH